MEPAATLGRGAPVATTATATAAPAPDGLLHEQVAKVALAHPDAVALDAGARTMTYAELDRRAEALAGHLQELGVGPDVLVGLSVERSPEMVVGLLAILKAGGAYLPLDPAYPAERRALVLDDAKPLLVVTQPHLAPAFEAKGFRTVDAAAAYHGHRTRPGAGPRDLAYVIHTSGSTGRPKGVLVEHEGLRHRLRVVRETAGLGPGDRMLQFASLNFDASALELMLALGTGATLVLGTREQLLPGPPLARVLRERRVTAALLPPSVLAALPDEPLPDLRLLMAGGEALHAPLVERWGRGRRFHNLYGPTEATIYATAELCVPGRDPTLGFPLEGTTAQVLDASLRPVPVGEPGEICLGGVGLARGYLHRPELTAERFVHDASGRRLYRTGDRGRVKPDGRIEFLGRLDRQVKVRGFRVEPGEVEDVLLRHPAVRDAAVEPSRDPRGEMRLVAYVVPKDSPPSLPRHADDALRSDLRAFLAARLPEPMVPTSFLALPRLPFTPNGKVDRAALPLPETLAASDAAPPTLARTDLERVLAEAWAEALGLPRVGLHEHVFDLGAHSLKVAQVQARVALVLGREVPVLAFFEHPTVAALAAHLGADAPSPAPTDAARERGAARHAARGRPARGRPAATSPSQEDDSLDP